MLSIDTRNDIANVLIQSLAPWMILACAVAIPLVWLASPEQPNRIIIPVLILVFMVPIWLAVRCGRTRHSRLFVLLCLTMPILVGMLLSGGIRAPVIMGILPITALVYCLYGKRQTAVFCMIAIAVGAIFAFLDIKQVLPPAPPPSAALILVCFTVWLSLAMILISTPVNLLHKALDTSEKRRKIAEKAIEQRNTSLRNLQANEERYRLLAENVNDVIWASDLSYNRLYLSPSYEKLTGISCKEALRLPLEKLMSSDSVKRLDAIVQGLLDTTHNPEETDLSKQFEVQFYRKDGQTSWAEMNVNIQLDESGNPIRIYGVARNIGDRKKAEKEKARLESRLAQSQRMEAIGTLAGGIAHDFNNILGAIIGFGEIIEMFDAPENSELQENLSELLQAAYRAKHLIKQILAMRRQSDLEMQPLYLDPILKEVIRFLRATLPATIEIKQNIANLPGTVLADATQLHQVVMNLSTNAMQAMAEKGGTLEINLNSGFLDEQTAKRFPELKPGAYAQLSVADTGKGISGEIQDRLFEPYFTTKARGKGTGLGLAVTHGIVRQHGGAIAVDSRPGEGAIFHVMLPLFLDIPENNNAEELAPLKNGKGRILLVDDEKALVLFGKKSLTHLGYSVETETDSARALERILENPERFDLIICDQTMPGITGLELAQNITTIRPGIPIILCTGFSDTITSERLRETGISKLISKPVGIRQLAQTISKLLKPQPGQPGD